MTVAVVIPAFNAADYLAHTLESVFAQTLDPAEVIVVDDGSTDATPEVAARLDVRCVRQDNAGPAAARNHGLRETTAPWVAFLDADDRFVDTKLERQLARLERGDAVACATDAWLDRGSDTRTERKNARRDVPELLGFDELIDDNPLICSSVVASRAAIEAAGGFDEDPVLVATEDYDLWLRLDGRIAYLDQPLTIYRVHDASLSDDLRFAAGIDRIVEKIAERHRGEGLEPRLADRRARVRIDAAYELARQGRGAEAREQLRRARELSGRRAWRIWVRSWFSVPPRRTRSP